MKTKLLATAVTLCLLISTSLAHADPASVVTPSYTSPGIGTLVVHWLFGR